MLVHGFVRELEIAKDEGYLTYQIGANAEQMRNSMPYQYLQRITAFALTVKGQDRARGIRVVQPLPNPAEDDGRAISALILQQIASAVAEEYSPQQILVFLREGGVPLAEVLAARTQFDALCTAMVAWLEQVSSASGTRPVT